MAASLTTGAFTIGLLLVLFRVYLEQNTGRAFILDFQQQYDLIGALLGAGGAFGLLAFTSRTVERGAAAARPGRLLARRMVLLTAFVAAVPLAVGLLWGVKAVGALLAGLVVGQMAWMLLSAWTVGRERVVALAASPSLAFVLAALVAIIATPALVALEPVRGVKLVIALGLIEVFEREKRSVW